MSVAPQRIIEPPVNQLEWHEQLFKTGRGSTELYKLWWNKLVDRAPDVRYLLNSVQFTDADLQEMSDCKQCYNVRLKILIIVKIGIPQEYGPLNRYSR